MHYLQLFTAVTRDMSMKVKLTLLDQHIQETSDRCLDSTELIKTADFNKHFITGASGFFRSVGLNCIRYSEMLVS